MGRQSFHSSSNFTDTLPHICVKTRKGLFTRFRRAKVANKETPDAGLVRPGPTSSPRSNPGVSAAIRDVDAFLDDVYVTTPPALTATVERSLEVNLWTHARIQVNQEKTQVWNRCGERLPDCDHLFFRTDGTPNDVWRGDPALPTQKKGVIVLGTPLGCADFVEAQLAEKTEEHGILLERIPKVSDFQRAHPEHSFQFALRHDAGITTPNTASSSPSATMQGSGSASKTRCTPQSLSQCGKWPVCHLELVG